MIRIESTVTRFLLPCLVLFAAACVKEMPTQTPVSTSPLSMGSSLWRVIDNAFVVTDASGTMYENVTFPEAKAVTQSFVNSMPDASGPSKSGRGYDAGLVGFSGEDRIASGYGPFDRGAMSASADELRIMGSIDGTGGTTPFRNIFKEISAELDGKSGPAAVVIISDGLADDPPVALQRARQLAENYPSGVCFHGVHTGDDPAGQEFLSMVSKVTPCGTMRSASTLTGASAYADFSKTVFADSAPPPMAGPCDGVIRLRGINFGFDKANITDDSAVVLDVAVDQLQQCPNVNLFVDGHTDWIGPEDYNQGLSERRASAARDYMVGRGIAPQRLQPRGFGENQPIAPNDTSEGRAQNRRVELKQR